jgi:hypothetical protein
MVTGVSSGEHVLRWPATAELEVELQSMIGCMEGL